MKRISKLLLTFVLVLTLMTGCVKYNVSMEVKDDKSVTLEILYGMEVDTSMMEDDSNNDDYNYDDDYSNDDDYDTEEENDSDVTVEDYKFLEDAGYKVEEYKEEKEDTVIAGVKITKTFKNIDDITADEKTTVDFTTAFNEENKDKIKNLKFFYKENGNYKADFVFDFSPEEGDTTDYSSYQSMFDLVYEVKLPTEVIESNATKVSEDKKTLTWDIEYGKKTNVNYEFALGGFNILIIVGVVAAIATVAVLVIVLTRKPKAPVLNPQGLTTVNPNAGMPDLLAPEPAQPQVDAFAQQPAVAPQATPVVPAPVVDGPAISFDAPVTPVMDTPVAPVAPQAPVAPAPMNAFEATPVAPMVEEPVVQAPVTPVAAPVVETPVVPTEPAVVATPVTPVAPQAPVMPEAPVQPTDNNNMM